MLKPIMRYFSYLYHLILGLFLLGVGTIAMFAGDLTLKLNQLPMWEDPVLTYIIFFGGLIGLASLLLAIKGKTRILFRLWTVVVFVLMFYGYFVTRFGFRDSGHFWTTVLLILGAFIAVVGSWTRVQKRA